MQHKRERKSKKRVESIDITFDYTLDITPFENILNNLKKFGMTVVSTEYGTYLEGKKLQVAVWDYDGDYNPGCIYIDREECFNKWTQCPLKLKLPDSRSSIERFTKHLTWLLSDEGLKASNSFDFDKYIKEIN